MTDKPEKTGETTVTDPEHPRGTAVVLGDGFSMKVAPPDGVLGYTCIGSGPWTEVRAMDGAAPSALATPGENCSTCRHHSSRKRPRVTAEAGYDDYVEFADDDETVYSCRAAGPFAGTERTVPIRCDAFEEGRRISLGEFKAPDRWSK